MLTKGKLSSSERAAEDDPSESPSEVPVEDGVDNRIEGWVDVAKPEGERKAPWLYVALLTHRRQQIEEKEGQPTEDEGAHDQTQDQSSSFLAVPGQPTPLASRILVAHR